LNAGMFCAGVDTGNIPPRCHFERSEKSDLRQQVILSRAKDLVILSGSLVSLETMLCIGFLPAVEMTKREEGQPADDSQL